MNCEKCQELLSDLLDDMVSSSQRALISKHLEDCADCFGVREELHMIVGAARECREELYTPPDSHAMWLRISNTIEGERSFTRAALAATAATPARAGFWSRLLTRRWEFTLPQMAAAVSAIAVSVALATAVGVQSLWTKAPEQADTKPGALMSSGPTGEELYPNAYMRQQHARISYLQQRVEQTKASWNPRMRDSFDRSLSVIDQAVVDSLDELKRNPHDEVSEEMLNSALRDKMELLREFSEQ